MGEGKSPSVSIIIPAYNRAHTIERAIQSVLNQTFQDFEIIVVDDGSTDETQAIVEGFRDPRIRYLCHERNRGAAAARNTGIKAAHGEYLAFLDSDDEWLPEKLSEQITVLQSAPDEVHASCTGYYLHLARSGLTLEKIPSHTHSWLRQLLLVGCDLSPGSTLVVRTVSLESVGLFDETLLRFEDWDWLIRYVKRYQLALVQKPSARVYLNDCPRALHLERSTAHFIAKHHADLQAFGSYPRRKATARLWFQVAEAFYRERKLWKGSIYFLKAFFENPFQRPGTYLLLLDAICETSMALRVSQFRQRLLRRTPR